MPDPATPLRIAVLANKTWECEPLVSVLTSKDGRPAALGSFRLGFTPGETPPARDPATGEAPQSPPEAEGLGLRANLPVRPRLSFPVAGTPGALVEVWCIEDWMRAQRRRPDGTTVPASSSSSREKFVVALPAIRRAAFAGQGPDLVIAFGTAGIPAEDTHNGCVVIGSRVYLNDPWDDAPKAEIAEQEERFGPLLQALLAGWLGRRLDCPRIAGGLFNDLVMDVRYSAEARFLTAPVHPALPPRILAGHGYASLGTLNIADYDDYVWADDETRLRFEAQIRQREIGSQETTHGLIRLAWHDTPFLYVSGLTDRVPWFNSEVSPRKYAQNFVAAHNAGCAVAQLLPELARLHGVGKLFDPKAKTLASDGPPLPTVSWPEPVPPGPRPRYADGETMLDMPWADLARAARATPAADVAGLLRARAAELFVDIDRDREHADLLACWGECLNVDENTLTAIVDTPILAAIGAPTGAEGVAHAGLAHTYGYLFSLLRTPFGFKRKRWVHPAIEQGFGLPRGCLGPTPEAGTLLTNVTWLAGLVALRAEEGAERLDGVAERVGPELRALDLSDLKRTRIVEEVEVDGVPVRLRTDVVAFRNPGPDTHLLVYSVHDPRRGLPRLITAFPVGADTVAALTAPGTAGSRREVRTRYNAFVEGLTRLGSRG